MTRFGSGSMDLGWHSGTGILGNPTIIAKRSTVGKCMFCMYVPGWWSGTIWTVPGRRDSFVRKVRHVVCFFYSLNFPRQWREAGKKSCFEFCKEEATYDGAWNKTLAPYQSCPSFSPRTLLCAITSVLNRLLNIGTLHWTALRISADRRHFGIPWLCTIDAI